MNEKSSIEIRQANRQDIFNIAEVHSLSGMSAYKDILSPEILNGFWDKNVLVADWNNYIKKTIEDKNLYAYVAIDNGEIVGVLRANNADEKDIKILKSLGKNEKEIEEYAHFKTIYIHPKHQGRGIGKMFITKFAEDSTNRGISKFITMTADKYEQSPKFFKSFGAQFVGQEVLDMKKHYDTTTSHTENSTLIINIWSMDVEDILNSSKEKDIRYYQNKKEIINKNKNNFRNQIIATSMIYNRIKARG